MSCIYIYIYYIYIQSTDGHCGNWSFSPQRINAHVALAAARSTGVVIVDSTREGKKFPDSFSKTLPIWCCVLNRAIAAHRAQLTLTSSAPSCPSPPLPENQWDTRLHLPAWVSPSEQSQIEAKLHGTPPQSIGWVEGFLASGTDISALSAALLKPLRPVGIGPRDPSDPTQGPERCDPAQWREEGFTPVLLVMASRGRDLAGARQGWTYMPGAGDDEEGWAQGFTPEQFHTHKTSLLDSRVTPTATAEVFRALMTSRREGVGSEKGKENGATLPQITCAHVATVPLPVSSISTCSDPVEVWDQNPTFRVTPTAVQLRVLPDWLAEATHKTARGGQDVQIQNKSFEESLMRAVCTAAAVKLDQTDEVSLEGYRTVLVILSKLPRDPEALLGNPNNPYLTPTLTLMTLMTHLYIYPYKLSPSLCMISHDHMYVCMYVCGVICCHRSVNWVES